MKGILVKRFKQGIKYIIKIIAAILISLLILSLFSAVYNYTGAHISNESGATDYNWVPGQIRSNMIEGFSWNKVDSGGFNNAYAKKKAKPDILIMGSSQMEAFQVSPKQSTAYLLNEKLPDYYTYNIGISGHEIYSCASNLKSAAGLYNPKKYIIIQTDSVELDPGSIQKVLDGKYEKIPSYDSGPVYYMSRYLPAARNIFKNVQDWRYGSANTDDETPSQSKQKYNSSYAASVNAFLNKIKEDGGKTAKIIILYNPPAIENEKGYEYLTNARALDIFSRACKENNIGFVDMTSDFNLMYQNRNKLAYGFTNTAAGTGHLNKFGHLAAANRLACYIKEDTDVAE